MSQFGILTSFDHNSQSWKTLKGRINQWFIANDVDKKEVKKKAILLAALCDGTFKLATGLALPKDLQEIPYDDIITLLDDHFTPKTTGFGERYNFYVATQTTGESYTQWAARLRGLTANCNFHNIEEALRDRFLMGMLQGPEREKLFAHDINGLTLAKAAELADSMRNARAVTAGAAAPAPAQQLAPAADQQLYKIAKSSNKSARVNEQCKVCGLKNHETTQCRYSKYKCKKCNEKGHLRRMCKKVNYIESEVMLAGNDDDGNIVSESTHSIDVLSGGESDAGDTLNRSRNNNSISSGFITTIERSKDSNELIYCIAKQLLMSERTYKRDLQLVTVTWSMSVSALSDCSSELVEALGRPCLALEPLALAQGAFLARLERCLSHSRVITQPGSEEPEYRKVADLLYDHLSSTAEAYARYSSGAGALAARVESARRRGGWRAAEAACGALDAAAPLPLTSLLLRPAHALLRYRRLVHELSEVSDSKCCQSLCSLVQRLSDVAESQLAHAENHAALCQLQRDIIGYDKLLVAEREFLKLGCVFKHSTKGLQQRMLYLFSDMLLCASKTSNGTQFRAQHVLPLHSLTIELSELTNCFILTDGETSLMLSAGNLQEFNSWRDAIEQAISLAKQNPTEVDTELTPYDQEDAVSGSSSPGGGALMHVCWHRVTSLSRAHLHLAMQTEQSGYLLRKFKNSHGWQKLWVVYAVFSLFFYKSWQDDTPLASLPLLGYSVGPPNDNDAIHKEFVFKLQYKNHVYFFRADSSYTYSKWIEALQTAMVHTQKGNV